MKVRTIRKHTNTYGSAFEKAVGDEYEHPSPVTLITSKIVEEASKPIRQKPTTD